MLPDNEEKEILDMMYELGNEAFSPIWNTPEEDEAWMHLIQLPGLSEKDLSS